MVSKLLTDFVSVSCTEKLKSVKIPISSKVKKNKHWEHKSFDLTQSLQNRITLAFVELKKEIENIDHKCLPFTLFGSDQIKTQKCSPDAFIQLAIQLAFYRSYGFLPAHYESASTRGYRHGRTETIRVSSMESLRFVQSLSTGISPQSAVLLRSALARQSKRTQDATLGYGVDRHLLGMRLIHRDHFPNKPMPAIFTDPTYTYSISWRMSTSQLGGDHFTTGYGAVVDDGLGVCYSYTKNTIHFKVATRHLTGITPKLFTDRLDSALRDLLAVLTAHPASKL